MPCLKSDFSSTGEYIVSYVHPVVLEYFNPSGTYRKFIQPYQRSEISLDIRVKEEIVHKALDRFRIGEMVHICRISQAEERQDLARSGSEYHEPFPMIFRILPHPVAAGFEICVLSPELQKQALNIVVIEFQGIRKEGIRIISLHRGARKDSGLKGEMVLLGLLLKEIIHRHFLHESY